ncbi:MAG TPA: Fic/DOC family N-terminal domain-containing protein [Thermoanaerobaculia bacterium]|jgi:Fic family protein
MIALETASRALGAWDGVLRALPRASALVQALLRREAVASAALEGIDASLADLALFESSGTPATERDAVREVANGVALLQHALAGTSDPLALHDVLMSGLRRRTEPPEANAIPPLADDLPRLVRAAIRHQHVSGDRRVARAILLAELGAFFDLSAYFVEHEKEYVAARAGAQTAWLDFFLRAVTASATAAASRLLLLNTRLDDWRSRVASARNAIALEPVLENLLAVPATTGARIAEMMEVTYPAARKTADALVERGVLIPTTVGKRHYFVAEVWG